MNLGKTEVVVDTNVAVVANGGAEQATPDNTFALSLSDNTFVLSLSKGNSLPTQIVS